MKLEFCPHILEQYSNSNFVKIRPVGAELFHGHGNTHTHRWTDMTNLIVCLRIVTNKPNNQFKASTLMGKAKPHDFHLFVPKKESEMS
jgi:hypothetical protein